MPSPLSAEETDLIHRCWQFVDAIEPRLPPLTHNYSNLEASRTPRTRPACSTLAPFPWALPVSHDARHDAEQAQPRGVGGLCRQDQRAQGQANFALMKMRTCVHMCSLNKRVLSYEHTRSARFARSASSLVVVVVVPWPRAKVRRALRALARASTFGHGSAYSFARGAHGRYARAPRAGPGPLLPLRGPHLLQAQQRAPPSASMTRSSSPAVLAVASSPMVRDTVRVSR